MAEVSDIVVDRELALTNYALTFRASALVDNERKDIVVKRALNEDGWEAFERELRILRMVRHKYIVELWGANERCHELYLPCIMGPSLGGFLDRFGKMPAKVTRHLLGMITESVVYLHEPEDDREPIVHYDISDNNCLIQKGAIKLIDFGTSFPEGGFPGYYLEEEIGTPRFMSPEKLRKQPEYGRASDVYGLGVIGYKMLEGVEPFLEAYGDLRRQILHDAPLPLSSGDPALDELIMACLEKNPMNRPTTRELYKRLG